MGGSDRIVVAIVRVLHDGLQFRFGTGVALAMRCVLLVFMSSIKTIGWVGVMGDIRQHEFSI